MDVAIKLPCGRTMLISQSDEEAVRKYKWCSRPTVGGEKEYRYVHAYFPELKKHKFLHRFLMDAQPGQCVDHVNSDGLDNRRENLRLATRGQNCQNQRKRRVPTKSRFKGVVWWKANSNWRACIRANGKSRWVGSFATEEDAARAYDKAARELHGEFARLNFPDLQTA